jgi:hypothetical protein
MASRLFVLEGVEVDEEAGGGRTGVAGDRGPGRAGLPGVQDAVGACQGAGGDAAG